MITIYVWPDNSFCLADEYDETFDSWKGDDYQIKQISEDELESLYSEIMN